MKKIVFLGLGLIGIVLGFLVVTNHSLSAALFTQPSSQTTSIETELEVSPGLSPSPFQISLQPVALSIPRLNVSTQVEWVGQDAEGRMDVPKLDENVAWYERGPQPGEIGSAVIAGHYDAKDGGPAVFYNLNQLKVGDEIVVTGNNQEKLTFVVTRLATYKDANFPLEEVFAMTDGRRLNLITCGGQFDQVTQNYSDRLVAYSELRP